MKFFLSLTMLLLISVPAIADAKKDILDLGVELAKQLQSKGESDKAQSTISFMRAIDKKNKDLIILQGKMKREIKVTSTSEFGIDQNIESYVTALLAYSAKKSIYLKTACYEMVRILDPDNKKALIGLMTSKNNGLDIDLELALESIDRKEKKQKAAKAFSKKISSLLASAAWADKEKANELTLAALVFNQANTKALHLQGVLNFGLKVESKEPDPDYSKITGLLMKLVKKEKKNASLKSYSCKLVELLDPENEEMIYELALLSEQGEVADLKQLSSDLSQGRSLQVGTLVVAKPSPTATGAAPSAEEKKGKWQNMLVGSMIEPEDDGMFSQHFKNKKLYLKIGDSGLSITSTQRLIGNYNIRIKFKLDKKYCEGKRYSFGLDFCCDPKSKSRKSFYFIMKNLMLADTSATGQQFGVGEHKMPNVDIGQLHVLEIKVRKNVLTCFYNGKAVITKKQDFSFPPGAIGLTIQRAKVELEAYEFMIIPK